MQTPLGAMLVEAGKLSETVDAEASELTAKLLQLESLLSSLPAKVHVEVKTNFGPLRFARSSGKWGLTLLSGEAGALKWIPISNWSLDAKVEAATNMNVLVAAIAGSHKQRLEQIRKGKHSLDELLNVVAQSLKEGA